MKLTSGQRLGSYEIGKVLGTGGMGEVYRAYDTRLKREVAVKTLPDGVSQDAERIARFQREAELLATLNHPHIAQIYGVEEGALILELVEGPTLAEVAASPVPVNEALEIACQLAAALDAAHQQGIIHRDLKPANIKLRPDGVVKVLDFGLAKAIANEPVGDPSTSPTLTAVATRAGMLVGTAAYMSPEQARCRAVDKRTDIWAFGCVLYELVTGRRAFDGETVSDTIAAVLDREPEWQALPADAPPQLRHLLRRCLNKDPRRRLRDIGDAQADLDQMLAGEGPPPAALSLTADRFRPSRTAMIVGLATLVVGGIAGWLLRPASLGVESRDAAATSELRLEITTPPTTDPVSFAISPDGQKLVFVATSEERSMLWLRTLNAVDSRPLAGTDDATLPFWSPDGRSVGFFATGQLKRIDLDSGAVRSLTATPGGRGGAWHPDGTIFYTAGPGNQGILRIPATGGEPVAVVAHGRFPQLLPDGQHLLYFVPQAFTPESRGVWVAGVDGSNPRRLMDADSAAVYARSGHLLFVRQGSLEAQPLDPATLSLRGSSFSLARGMSINEPPLNAGIATSLAGPIVYRSGSAGGLRQVAWIDRSGKQLETVGPPFTNIRSPSISPDRTRLAFHRTVNANSDIWVLDLRRGVLSRFTHDPQGEFYPLWSPDRSRLVYNRNRNLYQRLASGAGSEEVLLQTGTSNNATSWSSDGQFLLYFTSEPNPHTDIWALPMRGAGKPFPVVETSFNEREPQFSPDGKWIAFQSDESGRFEIYAQAFPGPASKVQISSSGGAMVRWRDDGKELYYISLDEQLMTVPIRLGENALEAGKPVALFRARIGGALPGNSVAQYVPSPDGQRFLMNTVADEVASPLTVILNWKARP